MKKFVSQKVNFLVFISLFLLISCASKSDKPRIVSLSSTMTEIVYSLGAGDQVIGATSWCFFPEKVMQDKASGRVKIVSDFIHTDTSRVDSLNPDIILTDTQLQRNIADYFKSKGYTVLHFEPKSIQDVFNCIISTGDAIGKGRSACRMIDKMNNDIAQIRSISDTLDHIKVYMEINHMGPWTLGSENPLNDLIQFAGGINVFGDTSVSVFRTQNNDVVRRNPDIILSPIWLDAVSGGWKGITPLFEIYTRPGYENTNAVARSRVLYYDSALMKHTGPRQILALKKLAYLFHPEHFENPPETISWELGWIK